MTLSRRLIITVAASVGVAIAGVSVAMGLLARDALIEQAEDQARLVAGLIASAANRAELTVDEIDRMIVSQMEAQALAIARNLENHDHDEEEGGNEALRAYFAKLTADSAVDDIWLLDEDGEPHVRAVDGLSESWPPDLASAGIDPRVVEALVTGRRFSVTFQSNPPGGWEKPMKYVGVRASNHAAVLVGTLATETSGPGEIIGIEAALDSLAGREAIQAIWVVNDLLDLIGMSAFEGEDGPGGGRVAPGRGRGSRHARPGYRRLHVLPRRQCPPCGGAYSRPRRRRHRRRRAPHGPRSPGPAVRGPRQVRADRRGGGLRPSARSSPPSRRAASCSR